MGLATSMTIVVGTGNGSKHGILFKTASSLSRGEDRYRRPGQDGNVYSGASGDALRVRPLRPQGDRSSENGLQHPLAEAVIKYARDAIHIPDHTGFESVTSGEARCEVDGRRVLVGSTHFLIEESTEVPEDVDSAASSEMTCILAVIDGRYTATVTISDPIREENLSAIATMKFNGLRVMMVT